jgi:hypothetical protein
MSDPLALVYDFNADLDRFAALVEQDAATVLREAAAVTAEAIIIGNAFGPGVPVDTGFARSSFRIGVNQPADGPTQRPYISRKVNKAGAVVFPALPDTSAAAGVALGDAVYITTAVEYPQYLEFTPKARRFGVNKGASTEFLEPVSDRFSQIVDDAVTRVTAGR